MWSLTYLVGIPVMSLILGVIYLWYNKPGLVLHRLSRIGLFIEGCTVHSVKVGAHTYSYAERGHQVKGTPSLVLVHGFTASKEMWFPLIQKLRKEPDLHVVFFDMPGHGESSEPEEDVDVSITGIAQLIHEFITASGLNKQPFHLVGLSLGGAVVGLYASLFPDDVAMLTITCPAMLTPIETKFQLDVKRGECQLLATTVEGMRAGFQMCVYHKHNCPENAQIIQGIIDVRKKHDKFLWKIFNLMMEKMEEEFSQLMKHVSEIQMPTQVIWGEDDEVLHVSGAEVLRQSLPDCRQYDILPHCGHMPTMDCPHRMADSLLHFRHRVMDHIKS